jgi:hypothetical protein
MSWNEVAVSADSVAEQPLELEMLIEREAGGAHTTDPSKIEGAEGITRRSHDCRIGDRMAGVVAADQRDPRARKVGCSLLVEHEPPLAPGVAVEVEAIGAAREVLERAPIGRLSERHLKRRLPVALVRPNAIEEHEPTWTQPGLQLRLECPGAVGHPSAQLGAVHDLVSDVVRLAAEVV